MCVCAHVCVRVCARMCWHIQVCAHVYGKPEGNTDVFLNHSPHYLSLLLLLHLSTYLLTYLFSVEGVCAMVRLWRSKENL